MSYSLVKHSSVGLSRSFLVLFLRNSVNLRWFDILWSQHLTTETTAHVIWPMTSNIAYSTHGWHLEVIYGNSADSVALITLECLVCLKIESNIDLKSGQSIHIMYQSIDIYFGPVVLRQFLFPIERTGFLILRHKLETCIIHGRGIFFISAN